MRRRHPKTLPIPFVPNRVLKNSICHPEERIQIFSETILGEAKRPQIQCLSLKGEFWPVGVP
jgi:hypothetical protein